MYNEKLAKELGIDEAVLEAAMEKAEKAVAKAEKAALKVMEPAARVVAAMQKSIASSKISKTIFRGVVLPSDRQYIRALVTMYYQIQGNRIKMANQLKAIEREVSNASESADSAGIMSFFTDQLNASEENIKTFLDVWTNRDPVCIWMKAQSGIGPVIAAGIAANFDITRAKTAGAFWKYIGWDGEKTVRKAGVKCNYNPKVRVLAWKAGHSFKMGYKKDDCFYGHLYARKKEEYIARNESGGFAETAKKQLTEKKFGENATKAKLMEGKISDAHIDAMALRFASKMFLSHVFDVMYIMEYGEVPPVPYVHEHLGHAHIDPPQKLELLRDHFNLKFPDKDFDELIYRAYHTRLGK
jgi:hypothetical protein